jgi:ornithine carbamoyltransferase
MESIARLKGRGLVTLEDLTAEEIHGLVDLGISRKEDKRRRRFPRALENRNIAMLFVYKSLRTRSAFLVAAADEGANIHQLDPKEIRFGEAEDTADIARVLGRMFDGIAMRTLEVGGIQEMARHAGIPVWNAEDNSDHPTQALADLMTLRENGIGQPGTSMAFVGNGDFDVVRSLIVLAGKVGLDLRVVTPPEHAPEAALVARAMASAHPGAKVLATSDLEEGLAGAQAIYGDLWFYMDQAEGYARDLGVDLPELARRFAPYKITRRTMEMTGRKDAILLHCLPSFHSDGNRQAAEHPEFHDIDQETFDGPWSRIFEQSENKMHTAKAAMLASLADNPFG